MKKAVIFFLAVVLLSSLSFHKAFGFAFIVDDWFQLWGVMFEKAMLNRYFSDHPSGVLEFSLLSKFFSFNPFYYYVFGFILKIICSLVVAFFVYGLTKSSRVSIFTGLIFASSVMGLEAFSRISAHNATFSIILLSFGMYFWVQQIRKNFYRNTAVSIASIIIALLADPGSSVMILPLMIIWDLATFYQNHFLKQELKLYLVRILLISLSIILVHFVIHNRALYFTSNLYSEQIQYAVTHPVSSLNNYLNSIGHLLIGWTIPVNEMMGISKPTILGIVSGYLLLYATIIVLILFIKKQTDKYKIIFFLLCWVLFFYFPSWVTQKHIVIGNLVIGVSNRYLVVCGVGLVSIFAVIISKIKSPSFRLFMISYVLVANITISNVLLTKEQTYRSVKVQNMLYDKINADVIPGSEKNSIFVFLGDSWFRVFAIDWNGVYPFALKRGLKRVDEFPLVINNLQDVVNKLCTEQDRYKLSNVYAWNVDDQNIVNETDQFREKVKNLISCPQ